MPTRRITARIVLRTDADGGCRPLRITGAGYVAHGLAEHLALRHARTSPLHARPGREGNQCSQLNLPKTTDPRPQRSATHVSRETDRQPRGACIVAAFMNDALARVADSRHDRQGQAGSELGTIAEPGQAFR